MPDLNRPLSTPYSFEFAVDDDGSDKGEEDNLHGEGPVLRYKGIQPAILAKVDEEKRCTHSMREVCVRLRLLGLRYHWLPDLRSGVQLRTKMASRGPRGRIGVVDEVNDNRNREK